MAWCTPACGRMLEGTVADSHSLVVLHAFLTSQAHISVRLSVAFAMWSTFVFSDELFRALQRGSSCPCGWLLGAVGLALVEVNAVGHVVVQQNISGKVVVWKYWHQKRFPEKFVGTWREEALSEWLKNVWAKNVVGKG